MFQILQSLACNGLHTIAQRCCRWLLTTHDRMRGGELPLTHDLLAIMLGVRRASVSVALHDLQKRGCLLYSRGKIEVQDRKILESGSCECYRAVTTQYERLLGAEGVPKRRREDFKRAPVPSPRCRP
jgi:hypothetical protein